MKFSMFCDDRRVTFGFGAEMSLLTPEEISLVAGLRVAWERVESAMGKVLKAQARAGIGDGVDIKGQKGVSE